MKKVFHRYERFRTYFPKLFRVASFMSVLQWGYSGDERQNEEIPPTLSSQSLIALLILTCHCTEKPMQNPYRQALFAFHNSQGIRKRQSQ